MSKWKRASILLLIVFPVAGCHHRVPPASGYGYWAPDPDFSKVLQGEASGSNGIEVGEPKIYDDSSLRLMLDQARQRLAAINGLSESALVGHLGAVTGSRIDQTQFGVQVTGPSLPGVANTANGPTSQTTTNNGLPSGTTLPASTTVTTNPSQSTVTTVPSAAPPASPSVPSGLAFAPPAGVSGSALDILNEQMQLTYEMANLQLLLEGSLSDRFVKNQRMIKPRATIGFPISLTPQPRYKNAVAVVEIEVETAPRNLVDPSQPDPPAITALLPREKTYNVAAIKDRMTSVGAGAVIGMVGVSGSFLSGHKTYYLVQDQDTVAVQRPSDPKNPNTTSFAWEFRPVLGEDFVRGGLKQTFVQLALPLLESDCLGAIRVRTYWRGFDRKSGIAEDVIDGSVLTRNRFSLAHYDLTPFVESVDYQDLGDGSVLVRVGGSFLAGTYIQLGPTRYDASKGLQVDESGLTFVAPAVALARWTGKLISRDGKQADLLNVSMQKRLQKLDQQSCGDSPSTRKAPSARRVQVEDVRIAADRSTVELRMKRADTTSALAETVSLVDENSGGRLALVSSVVSDFTSAHPGITAVLNGAAAATCQFGSVAINDVKVSPLNESDSTVTVTFNASNVVPEDVAGKTLLEIGNKIFGLRDTTTKWDMKVNPPTMTVVVPSSLLVASQKIRAFRIFWTAPDGEMGLDPRAQCFNSSKDLADFGLDSSIERLVLVSVDTKGKGTYLLYGNGLANATVLLPAKAKLSAVNGLPKDRVLLLEIEKDDLQGVKKLLFQKASGQHLLVLDLPQADAKAQPPKVTLDSPVIQNTDEMEVAVEKVDDLASVKMAEKDLQYTKGKDSIRLKNLRADGVTAEQKTRELTFEFKDKTKVAVKLEVVAARVGTK
jgi:hypothetical protein